MSVSQEKNALHHWCIFLLCVLTYVNAANSGFFFDDAAFLGKGIKSIDVGQFFVTGFHGFYRPTAMAVLKFINAAFKEDPLGYYVLNLGILIVLGNMIYILVRKLFKNAELALLTACLYVAHPVNNIFINFKMLSAFMLGIISFIGAILLFLKFVEEKKAVYYVLSLLCYMYSLFNHEITFVLPLYLACILHFVYKEKLTARWKLYLPYVAGLLLLVLVRSQLPGLRPIETVLQAPMPLASYIATVTTLLSWYLSGLFPPFHVLLVWDTPPLPGSVLLSAVFLGVALFCLYLIFRWKDRAKALALSIFLVGLIPFAAASMVYVHLMGRAIIEPHWFAFSSIGFFVLMASAALSLKKKMPQKVGTTFMVAAVLWLSAETQAINTLWKDNDAYCNYWLSINPTDQTVIEWKERPRS